MIGSPFGRYEFSQRSPNLGGALETKECRGRCAHRAFLLVPPTHPGRRRIRSSACESARVTSVFGARWPAEVCCLAGPSPRISHMQFMCEQHLLPILLYDSGYELFA